MPDKEASNVLEKASGLAETTLKARIADLKQLQRERLPFEGSELYAASVKGEISRMSLKMPIEGRSRKASKAFDKELLQAEKDYKAFVRNTKEQKKFVNALVSVKDKSVLTPELVETLILCGITLTADRHMEIPVPF